MIPLGISIYLLARCDDAGDTCRVEQPDAGITVVDRQNAAAVLHH
jgi:hypothetical protein